MKLTLCTIALLLVTPFITWADDCSFPGQASSWHGYAQHDFEVDGRKARVVCPEVTAEGKPWIWRARFWGHEPQTDLALLKRGFHVNYIDVGALFGNKQAVFHWNAFYLHLTSEHGFSKKPALEGMSRGGLIAFNWAIANPTKVACIYADAPVMDFKSWPGGKGVGVGSKGDWAVCQKVYGFTEAEALAFKGNPVDSLEDLAKAGVPLLHVVGAVDKVVPVAENTSIAEKNYTALGGDIRVISKKGIGHHPHSLENPSPIVEFVLKHTGFASPDYTAVRGGLKNSGAIFKQTGKGRVGFLGGSITEMKGWRALTYAALERRFPENEFQFVNAGLSSTDSTLGAFRLEHDAFREGPLDLLFIEFAVNDNHNSRAHQARIRGMEGIIRHARTLNPKIDIIVQYFVEPANMEIYARGETPPIIVDHDRVTQYYDVTAINLSKQVTEDIARGDYAWSDFKDLHPSPFGHKVYSDRINSVFDVEWKDVDLAKIVIADHPALPKPLDALNYERGRYVDVKTAKVVSGWKIHPSWGAKDGAHQRRQFQGVPTLEALHVGAELSFEFEGMAVGLRVVAGPDVGILEYSIDGKDYPPMDQFTQWSAGLHIPWAYLLAADLKPGKHRLVLKMSEKNNEKSKGHAARIQQFLVN